MTKCARRVARFFGGGQAGKTGRARCRSKGIDRDRTGINGEHHVRKFFQEYAPITIEIRFPEPPFHFAETCHQQYLAKNPAGYCGLRGTGVGCPIAVPGVRS